MKNKKWGTISYDKSPMYVVLFVSRLKDNKDKFKDFKERRTSFITTDPMDSEYLQIKFKHFVEDGQPGEFCRMYYSVNERDSQTVYKKLIHFLIDEPEFNLCAMPSKLAGIAADKDCAKSKHWMFDFDYDDEALAKEFCEDIKAIDPTVITTIHKTPHGYAIITDRGFDYRTLIKSPDPKKQDKTTTPKWVDVDLKKDDLLCIKWMYTE